MAKIDINMETSLQYFWRAKRIAQDAIEKTDFPEYEKRFLRLTGINDLLIGILSDRISKKEFCSAVKFALEIFAKEPKLDIDLTLLNKDDES